MTKNTQLIFHSFELVQISRVISGTAIIWLFSSIDSILLGRIFNQAKKAVGTVENPYFEETTDAELAKEL